MRFWSRFWKNNIFTSFWAKKIFFGHPKNFGIFDLVGPLPRVPGGVPPGGGVESHRRGLLYHFPALDFENQDFKNFKKRRMPPLGPAPWTPHFFDFSILDQLFYIFFFYYITVFIFSLFLFTFFSIIEGRAVVIQPPQ